MNNLFEITPADGFAPQIGCYVSQMNEVREQLCDAVRDLSNEEISKKFAPGTHSIGQLTLHNAEAEWWWMQVIVSEKPLDEEQAKREAHWDVLLDENFAEKNYSAEFCLSEIERVSVLTRELLRDFADEDLERRFSKTKRDGTTEEYNLRWILHHLTDHEAQHKGQILMLKRLIRD